MLNVCHQDARALYLRGWLAELHPASSCSQAVSHELRCPVLTSYLSYEELLFSFSQGRPLVPKASFLKVNMFWVTHSSFFLLEYREGRPEGLKTKQKNAITLFYFLDAVYSTVGDIQS